MFAFLGLDFPQNPSSLPSSTQPGLGGCMQEACPAGITPLEDSWFWYSFSFHCISSEFSLVVFV